MDMHSVADDEESTIVNVALVARLDIRKWSSVKAAVKEAGGELIFQKLAPLGTFLWIEQRDTGARAWPTSITPATSTG